MSQNTCQICGAHYSEGCHRTCDELENAENRIDVLEARLKAAEAVMIPAQSLLSVYEHASDEWGCQLNAALEAWREASK